MTMEAFDFGVPNQALVSFFEVAENEISRLLSERLDDFGRFRLAEIQDNLTPIIDRLRIRSTQWSGSILPAIYQRSIESTFNDLRELGIATNAVNANFQRLNIATIEALVANSGGDLVRAVNESQRNIMRRLRSVQLSRATQAAFDKSLAISSITGEGVKAASARLAEIIGKPLVTIINGREFRTSHYSRLVAVTRTREASTMGVKNTMAHNGEDLVMVSSHPHKKDICTPFDGKIFSVSGTSEKFPSINLIPSQGPPFHPFCRHVLLPFIEELAEPEEIAEGTGISKKFLDPNKKPSEINKLAKEDESVKEVKRGITPKI